MSPSGDGTDPQQDLGPTTPDAAAQLMRQFQRSGDRVALERALLLCAPALRRAAVRLAGAGEADDLLQECFLVAIGRVATFEPEQRLLPWLLGILNNVFRSRHRRRWARLRMHSARLQEAERDAAELATNAPDAPTTIDHREWQRRIGAAAEGLAEPYRTVVIEHLCVGTPLVQVAQKLGRTPSTVRSQFHRGLQELRRRLPTPLLGGLVAVLAVRDGRSIAAGSAASTGMPLPRSRLQPAWFALAAMLLLIPWLLWQQPDAQAAASSTFVAAAAEPPRTVTPTDSPKDLAADRSEAPSPTRRLHLRLLHQNGSPAKDIPVWCDPDFVTGIAVARVHQGWIRSQTDADGAVVFDVPKHTFVTLRLHELARLGTLPPGDNDAHWTLTAPPGHRIQFECVNGDGLPVADATILVSGSGNMASPSLAVATSDELGRGSFLSVLQNFHLWAIAPGHRVSGEIHGGKTSDPAQAMTARFHLMAAERRIQGRVLDQDGRPIRDAVVAVWSRTANRLPHLYLRSDAHGAFATDHLPLGDWGAAAVAPGHAVAERACKIDENSCELVLYRGVDVSGRVDGIAGVQHDRLRISTRDLDGISNNPLSAGAALVAADGSFVLRNMRRGRLSVGVFDTTTAPMHYRDIEITDAATPLVQLSIAPKSCWQIRVVDTRGRPVPGCLLRSDGYAPIVGNSAPDQATTDGDGRAILRRHAAPRRLSLYLQQSVTHDVFPLHVIENAAPPTTNEPLLLTIDPELERCSVRGRLPEQLRPDFANGLLTLGRSPEVQRVATDNGLFQIDNLPPGDGWRLLWHQSPDAPLCRVLLAAFDLAPGQTLDLESIPMARLGTLRQKLVSGTILHAALFSREEVPLLFTGLAPGVESTCLLPAGAYRLDFAGPDGARRSRSFDIAPDTTTLIELASAGGQTCRLFVAEDRVIPGTKPLAITIEDLASAGSSVPYPMVALFNGALTGWSLDIDLQPGSYRVTAEGADGVRRGALIVVSARPGLQTFPLERQ